ncbi:MAG: hypothetical protein KAX10_00705 [Candidatus Lokiarchaeota archaeon]|nr:hypothetical protein [Candidatus Lokiarchaeota archaeon]
MKPWLSDILACPIDKYYPLELLILKWETNISEIEEFLKIYKIRDEKLINNEELIKFSETENHIKIRDSIALKSKKSVDYLNAINSSIQELNNINNLTKEPAIDKCIDLLKTSVKRKIESTINQISKEDKKEKIKEIINSILPELYLINKFKIDTEIEEGILFCSKCNRWYPIVETIPQMLPDKYRNENEDIAFLNKWKQILEQINFFQRKLIPFNK